MDATRVRVLLQAGGYAPIPVVGKAPALLAWQKHLQTNLAEIALWVRLYPDAINTGILTRLNPVIDSDITDELAAEAVEDLAREYFEERGHFLVRIGKWPKRAILLRTDVPFGKITRNLLRNGVTEKIEILCDGQQVVVHGIHPETKHPYLWHGGEPGPIKYEDLPYVRADELTAFADAAVVMLVRDFGYTAVAERPKATNGAGNGEDWAYLINNIIAGRELHDSARDLAAKFIRAGMQGGATVNVLRTIFDMSSAPHDQRWHDRVAELPRDVASAERKYAKAPEPPPHEQPAAEPHPNLYHRLDRASESGTMQTDWTVDNMLPVIGVAILSGHPGVGKTHIVNDLMCSVATGMPFAGHEVGRVCGAVLFAAEGAETAPQRWQVLRHAKTGPWFESMGLPADTAFPVTYTGHVPYLNADDAFELYDAALDEVADLQAAHMAEAGVAYGGLGLVCIDTYNAATSLTDDQHNRVGSTQAIFNMLRKLAIVHRCCVVVVDHLGKDTTRGPLGSINKTAAPDVDLRVHGTVGEDGSVNHTAMVIHKLRAGPQGKRIPFELKVVTLPHEPLQPGESGMTVRWDIGSGAGMHVPKQNKRHHHLMKALDEAILEACQWVRLGDNANYKAADSRLVRTKFELSHPATSEEGEKRTQAIKRAFNRAIRDSSDAGLIASKTMQNKSVVIWRTDYKFGDGLDVSHDGAN